MIGMLILLTGNGDELLCFVELKSMGDDGAKMMFLISLGVEE